MSMHNKRQPASRATNTTVPIPDGHSSTMKFDNLYFQNHVSNLVIIWINYKFRWEILNIIARVRIRKSISDFLFVL